jgi:adsorption protein B
MVTPGLEPFLEGLTAFVALAIFISGLDDLFIDCCYYGGQAYRRFRYASAPRLTEAALRAEPEQSIGIMIPAWHEHAVIAQMLRNTLRTVDYRNYDIFVGTYPNDEPTMLAVAEVAEDERRVHRIVCPHDGPTCKADCLNWIIEGIRVHDKKTGRRTDILMLHDSEDMVHPLSFRLMNHFIPLHPMVQLPVIPLETPLGDITAGTYLDEFAESHIKDMLVRERVSGMVPSAGVGTGFAREAIDRLALKHDNQVFNVGTFTEDYDLAFRLKAAGHGSILLQYYIERTRHVPGGWLGRKDRLRVDRELVGTREYFPSRARDAMRQKARWTLGIVFHGWQQRGWEGGAALRYMIWRDRKTLMTNAVNMLGYLLLLEAALGAWGGWGTSPGRLQFHVPAGSWLWTVILADAVLLLNRCAQRMICTWRVSDGRQALLSLPRIIWGNVINFCAVAKAAYLFILTSLLGKKLVWAKTAHAFPSEEQLVGFKRKLGDLLLENRLLSLQKLNHALQVQREKGNLLGEVLVDLGYVPEAAVVDVLGLQLKVETRHIDFRQVRGEALGLIMECACREHLMVAVETDREPVVVAAADVADPRMKRWLDANLGRPYRLVLAGRRNIVQVIDRAAQALAPGAVFGKEEPGGLSAPGLLQ